MGMTGFICQDTYLARTAKLSDQEVGRLFRALMKYHATGEEAELAGRESIAFDFIKEDIDRAEESYSKKCEQARNNRLNGSKRTITDDNARQRPSTESNGSEQIIINNNKNKIKKEEKEQKERAFDRFWAEYPRKEAKPKARDAFMKINPDEELLDKMLTSIAKWKASDQWQEDGGRYIPHPTTWLNQQRWNDEPQQRKNTAPVKQGVVAQQYEQRDYSGYHENPDDILDRISNGVLAG